MYMAGMMTWEFVLSRSNPLDLGTSLYELAHDEVCPEETQATNPLYGELWALWLLNQVVDLDPEDWTRCAEGLLAFCEHLRLQEWDEAHELLTPFDQRYWDARERLLPEEDEFNIRPSDDEDEDGDCPR